MSIYYTLGTILGLLMYILLFDPPNKPVRGIITIISISYSRKLRLKDEVTCSEPEIKFR